MNKVNKKRPYIYLLLIIVLLLSAEAVFLYKNKGEMVRWNTRVAKVYVKRSKPNHALAYFNKAAEVRLKEVSSNHPEIFKQNDLKDSKIADVSNIESYIVDVLSPTSSELVAYSTKEWAKSYYKLAVGSYDNGLNDMVDPFLQNAIVLAPQWSYFYIELANYYQLTGKYEMAVEQIQLCMDQYHPKSDCQSYYEKNLKKSQTNSVGFLKKKIEKI